MNTEVTKFAFTCQPGCTNCCREKGWVYLTEADIVRLAGFLSLPQAELERRYVYRTKNTRRFRKPRGSQCPFLRDNGCSVHAAKPEQCRTFPFWPEITGDADELRAVAAYCPGIGEFPLVQITTEE